MINSFGYAQATSGVLRDRSVEILQRASKIAAEKRQQQEEKKSRIDSGVEKLAGFVRKLQEIGAFKVLREYPQIRVIDQSHIFSISYRRLTYTVQVDMQSGNLLREMALEKDIGKAKAQDFDENRAIDDVVEYIAIMVAKIQLRE